MENPGQFWVEINTDHFNVADQFIENEALFLVGPGPDSLRLIIFPTGAVAKLRADHHFKQTESTCEDERNCDHEMPHRRSIAHDCKSTRRRD